MKVDGEQRLLEEEIELDKKFKHTIEVVVDRLVMKEDLRTRLCAVDRDRGRARRGPRRDRRRRRRGADVLRAVRLPRARRLAARAPAADLLLQLAARRLPALHRASARSRRSTPTCSSPTRRSRSPRARSCRGRSATPSFYESVIQAIAERWEIDLDKPWQDLTERAAGPVPVRHQGRADLRPVPQPHGAEALVHAQLRGDRPQPAAALPRDRLGAAARADRGVHVVPALPGVRRRAAQARGAGGHRRRAQHPRVHEDVGDARARSSSTSSS